MASTESQRLEMYRVLREKLGVDTANTLVDQLPPRGWGDLVTKTDLSLLEERLNARFAEMISTQNKWMTGMLATLVVAMIVALVR